ncbi:MAG: glycosyltransferase family 4 protein, partial [Candidatus Woesearchaeota archaeon]
LSSLHEGMSNALLEAMYAKVPVIVSNIEENTELITHNEDGLTFKVKNHKDLLNKMNFSYNNQSKIKKMALNAHKKITKTYNTNKIITKYEHIVRAT